MLDFLMKNKVIIRDGWQGRREYEVFSEDGEGRSQSRMYRRLAGGVGWPGHGRPGFLMVVGEDVSLDPEYEARHLHRLMELDTWEGIPFMAVQPMLEAMSFITSRTGVHPWFGLPCPSLEDLTAFNREKTRLKRAPLRIAQLRDPDLERFLQPIFRRTTINKTLHLGRSEAANRLARLPRDISKEGFDKHPQITALAMAVNGLDYTEPPAPAAEARRRIVDRVGGY